MSHTPQCRIRKELTGNIWTYYSDPDQSCTDASHNTYYTEENK
jgi:hypothetical protein